MLTRQDVIKIKQDILSENPQLSAPEQDLELSRRYADLVRGQQSTQNQQVTPQIQQPTQGTEIDNVTVSDLYSGLVPEVDQQQVDARNRLEDILKEQVKPVDESAIRQQTLDRFQAEIDALNRVYVEKRLEEEKIGQGRLGSSTAIQARRGLLGSDFGAAQTEQTQNLNQQIIRGLDEEKNLRIQNLLGRARSEAQDEIQAKQAARKAGAQEYIDFLAGATERKNQRISSTLQNLLSNKIEVDDTVIAQLAKELGVSAQILKSQYTQAKAAKDAADLASKPKTETFQVNNVLYEKQSDGTYKSVTPTPAQEPREGIIGEYEYYKAQEEAAGRVPMSFNEYQTYDINRAKKVSSIDTGIFPPFPPVPTTPTEPKQTFEEFLASEEQKAGQSLSQAKRDELKKQFEAAQVEPTIDAQNADLSAYSFQVQQAIAGIVNPSDLLTGGTAGERRRYAQELEDAKNKGLLKQVQSPAQQQFVSKLNDSISKNATYAKTVSMRTFAQNVLTSLGQETGAADIAAINQFQKVIDEGAVTRDQDVRLIQSAQSLMNTLKIKIKKLQKGDQLSPELRAQMGNLVNALYTAQIEALNKDPFIKSKTKEAKNNNVDLNDTIISELGSFEAAQITPQDDIDAFLSTI